MPLVIIDLCGGRGVLAVPPSRIQGMAKTDVAIIGINKNFICNAVVINT